MKEALKLFEVDGVIIVVVGNFDKVFKIGIRDGVIDPSKHVLHIPLSDPLVLVLVKGLECLPVGVA